MFKLFLFLVLIAASSTNGVELPTFKTCETSFFNGSDFNLREVLFYEVLSDEPSRLNSSLTIDFLYANPRLADLKLQEAYDGTAGVSEGYTLREHTRMVLNVFREQAKFYDLNDHDYRGMNLKKLMQFILAIHDLGKGLALQDLEKTLGRPAESNAEFKQASARQSEYTMPMVQKLLKIFEFNEIESAVTVALIEDDVMGGVVTGKADVETAYGMLVNKAEKLGMSPVAFFNLKLLYFVSDAASYPGLRYGRGLATKPRSPVFVEQEGGQLLPVSATFRELLERFVRLEKR